MSVRACPWFLAVFLLGLLAQAAWAADIYTVANGATSTINELGVCKKVTNDRRLRPVADGADGQRLGMVHGWKFLH